MSVHIGRGRTLGNVACGLHRAPAALIYFRNNISNNSTNSNFYSVINFVFFLKREQAFLDFKELKSWVRSIGTERNFEPPTQKSLGGKSCQGHLLAVVGHLCLSTEGIPSLRRGRRPSSPVCPLHPLLSFTGLRLVWFFLFLFFVFAYRYIFLCLFSSLPCLPPSPLPEILLSSFILSLLPPYLCTLPPPQAKQCSEYHTTHEDQMQIAQTSLSLHLVTQANKSRRYLS